MAPEQAHKLEIDPNDFETAPASPNQCPSCGAPGLVQNWTDVPQLETEFFLYYHCHECGEKCKDNRDALPDSLFKTAPSWRDIFGHPEPYDHQEDAIKHVIEAGVQNGYSVVEGGCGTGKTQIALTAGARLVRDPQTQYEQVLVLTSVKQQLQQFEQDLRIINQNLPIGYDPISAVTLVGKGDVCPYAITEEAGFSAKNVNHKCRSVRAGTSTLIGKGYTGQQLASHTESNSSTDWSVNGTESPYPPVIPSSDNDQYCPFYAGYKGMGTTYPFEHAEDHIVTANEAVRLGLEHGMCPHSAISTLCNQAEVIFANYTHAYDWNTLNITREIIDKSTFLICDEAHMNEPRVRDIMSESTSAGAIWKALSETKRVAAGHDDISVSKGDVKSPPPLHEIVNQELADEAIPPELLQNWLEVLKSIISITDNIVEDHLDSEYPGWKRDVNSLPQRVEIPLQNPRTDDQDAISSWAENHNIPELIWKRCDGIGEVIEEILNQIDGYTDARASPDVANLFYRWFDRGHTKYFRELTLYRDTSATSPDSWRDCFTTKYELHNCMPRGMIGNQIGQFGGGLFMSATLDPIDVFCEVMGLDYFEEVEGRPVKRRRYNVSFPEENRLSLAVNLKEFTWENRGPPSKETPTRKQYAASIRAVARATRGNLLVCMPSYAEGEWAGEIIRNTPDISTDVLIDRSSGEAETKTLKQEFFSGGPKVLVTSLRGTLTEGVDYDGDKLAGCIVCGVPIEKVDSPRTQAVISAYRDRFGYQKGFEYGMTIPAVRKARQALGRVIRGKEDVGVRVVVDERYCNYGDGGVRQYLSEHEQEAYEVVETVDDLASQLSAFDWRP
jgi:DNA excision repair protein ERCC-2